MIQRATSFVAVLLTLFLASSTLAAPPESGAGSSALRSWIGSWLPAALQDLAEAALSQEAMPAHWRGPGPLHKVWVERGHEEVLATLTARGAVQSSYDYGSFTLAVIDERALGGAEALRALELDFRDELDLIVFNELVLNTQHPQELLGQLDPGELYTSPGSTQLDPYAGLYVVQFAGPIRDEWLTAFDGIGIEFRQYVPQNAYVVALPPDMVPALEELGLAQEHVQYVGAYEPAFKLHAMLRADLEQQVNVARKVTVQLVDGDGVRDVVEEIAALADQLIDYRQVGPYVNVRAVLHPAYYQVLTAHPRVFQLEPLGERTRNDERQGQITAGNVTGGSPSAPGYLAWLASQGFNSSQFGSFSVNIVDDALGLTGHPDIPNSRVDFTLNPTSQGGAQGGHGFLNAHIVAGFNNGTGSANEDGGGYNYGLGIAPWAHVGSTAIFGSGSFNPSAYESTAYGNGARISTNSWTFEIAGNPIPDYDSSSQEYDFIVRDAQGGSGNQEYMVFFSAGNDGPGGNTVSTPATAKNIMTIGAGENDRQTGTDGCGVPNSGANDWRDIISFSSRGPVNSSGGDGRWKPELVAPGTHIQAGVPQSNYNGSSVCNAFWPSGQTLYGWSSGTSHSTPAVAGGAALVYQWFLNESLPAPSPAMMKAVLTLSGEYMTGALANDTLPSNVQGTGTMNLGRAFDGTPSIRVDQSQVLSGTGASYQATGSVSSGGLPFRVALVWTDAPGPTSGAPFVNDLNLTVDVGGSTYRGNVFSGAHSTTGGSADIRNNSEIVFLPAGTTGNFTVTVTAASIGGDGVPGNGDSTDQDFALVIYNGSTGPVPPTANFSGSPTSGNFPLQVNFTDTSSGGPTSWSWSFGDGGTSTAQNPSHTYTSAGTYTVSLDVTGPTGSDNETKVGYITVNTPPAPGISDGSFESQSAGSAPTTPWTIDFGSGHVVNPAGGTSSDGGMPTDGSNWVELSASSTNNATPPSNPGGATNPPSGGAGVSQSFSYASGTTLLSFDAAFARNETANSTYNDWMSVDITDGSTWQNLYYADTGTATPQTSSKHGFAMTAVSNVSVDLATLFPSSTTSTTFTITALVGNGTDGIQPSIGYADNFALAGTGPVPPTADFSGTPTSGTIPLGVNFTDASTGDVTSWSWSFGDGGTSTAQNPSHTYTAAGTYDVTLTATGPGGSDVLTRTDYITANEPPPSAAFTGTPTSGTAPLAVSFTDATTGNVTSWSWAFGDGGTSTAQNPNHTYTSAGTYSVTLTATGPGGSDVFTRSNYITVNEPPPTADFSGSPTTGDAPLAVSFSDASTGAITSWSWTFGDGGTSTAQNPNHTYTAAGTYDVTLTVTGPGGSDVLTRTNYITANEPAPSASFTGTPTSGIAPLAVSFTDSSSGAITSWSWTFGDGGTSTAQNPNHTYTAVGTYSVSLTVTGPGGSDVLTRTNYISVGDTPPSANFTGTPTSGTVPLAVAFTDSSSGPITSWSWAFGDGGTSTAQNPNHTYTSAGTYSVTLTVTGPGGSDALTRTNYITVNDVPPVADFTGSPTSGTAPLGVSFSDASSGNVTSWSWTFGDGGTSTAQNPSHTYTAAGTYDVSLTVTGPGGSDGETKLGYITVSDPAPVAEFTGSPTSGTTPLLVSFTDASSGPVTSWSWTFGDGGTSTAQNPSHTYAAAGTYDVSLTVTGPGGSDVEVKIGYVTVSDPPTGGLYYLSFVSNTVVPGVGTVADDDVVTYDPATGLWELYFDGSDVGIGGTDIVALHVRDDGNLIMSFNSSSFDVPGLTGGPLGTSVDDSDLILFTFTQSGPNTAGSFSFLFDGSDVLMTNNSEDIDGVHEFDDGTLAFTTLGNLGVSGLGTQRDEDVVLFTPTSLGSTTAGSFSTYFDGSDVQLNNSGGEDTDAITFDDQGDLIFSTRGSYSALGSAGDDEDISRFSGTFGTSTSGTITLEFDLSALGIDVSEDVDGITFR